MARILKPFLPKRGELYLTDFEPSVGAEIRKIRPALIIQNDTLNEHSPLVTVAALSSKTDNKLYPFEVLLSTEESSLPKDSLILLNQIHSFDKVRLIKKLGSVSQEVLAKVDEALKISLGMV